MTNKINLLGTKIRIKNEEHREAVRDAFKQVHYDWYSELENEEFLFVSDCGNVGFLEDESLFDRVGFKEVIFDMNTKQFSFEEHNEWKPEAGKPARVLIGGVWYETRVIGYGSEGECVFKITDEIRSGVGAFNDIYYDSYCKTLVATHFKPIESEEEKFCKKLEEISEGILGRDGEAAKAIYNAIKSGELSVG